MIYTVTAKDNRTKDGKEVKLAFGGPTFKTEEELKEAFKKNHPKVYEYLSVEPPFDVEDETTVGV